MKNILSVVLLFVVISFSACSDDDFENKFEKSPEARVAEVNQSNMDILASAENGWLGYYSSIETMGAWPVLMNFTNDGWVKIKNQLVEIPNEYGEMITILNGMSNELSYNVNTTQTTNLVFESGCVFNLWHALKKNNPTSTGGVVVSPLGGGEFQFIIKSATSDRIVLESLTDKGEYKTELVLRKAKEEDWYFDQDKLAEMKRVLTDGATSNKYFRAISIDGTDFQGQFRVDPDFRMATFDYLEDGERKSTNRRIAITTDGFVLMDSLSVDETTKIAKFVYDQEGDAYLSEDSGVKTKIEYSNRPGIIYFPFVDEWGTKDGKKVDCTMDYSVQSNLVRTGAVSWDFYNLGSAVRKSDGLKNIDFYMNNEKNPSGCSTTITLKYNKLVIPPFGYRIINVDIPVEVIREENTRVIFKLKDDYRKAYRDDIEHIELVNPDTAEELIKVLTNEEGFYLMPSTFYTGDNIPYAVVMMISVVNPNYRLTTEYLEFISPKED
jgi:hypothetical protein